MLIKFDSRHAMGTFHGIHGSLPALLEQWRLGASDAEHRANWALWVSHTYIDKRDRVHRAHDRLAMLSDACARADRVAVHPSLPMHKVIPVLRTNAVGHWKRVFHLIERTLRSLSAPPPSPLVPFWRRDSFSRRAHDGRDHRIQNISRKNFNFLCQKPKAPFQRLSPKEDPLCSSAGRNSCRRAARIVPSLCVCVARERLEGEL